MKRELSSSSLTFFYKFIFPILLILVGALFAVALPQMTDWPAWLFAAAFSFGWVHALVLSLWLAFRLKTVSLDEEFFYVSGFRDEIQIPLEEIEDVSEGSMRNPKLITLVLRSPKEFGEKVLFIPERSLLDRFGSKEIVSEIRIIIETRSPNRSTSRHLRLLPSGAREPVRPRSTYLITAQAEQPPCGFSEVHPTLNPQ